MGEENECFVPDLEDEASEVEFLLVEPKHDHATVDGVLHFREENPEKGMQVEGQMDSRTVREGEDDLKLQVLNIVPHEVDGDVDMKAANCAPCMYEDYLLDFEFAESVPKMDYVSCEGLQSKISHAESQIPASSQNDHSALGISELSTTIPVPEYHSDLLDKKICKLHCVCTSQCGCETPVDDQLWPKQASSYEVSADRLESVQDFLDRDSTFDDNEEGMIFPSDLTSRRISCNSMVLQNNEFPVGQGIKKKSLARRGNLKSSAKEYSSDTPFSQKRMRKPPQRYIEESSDLSLRRKRQRTCTSTSREKLSGFRNHKKQVMGSRAMNLDKDEYVGRVCIPVPFGSPVRSENRNEHVRIKGFNSDEDPSPAEAEDKIVRKLQPDKSSGRRKHHIVWSLMEVRKLIDGVSEHGVGRWTVIKKLLFSSSAHRTPVDLKDKWRNLLRASCLQMQSNREDEHKQKHAWRPLPKSVLRRVRELAVVYPYPRDQNSKLLHGHRISVPAIPARSTDAPSSSNERTKSRKNYS